MDVKERERSSETYGVSLVGLLMVVVVLGALTATGMLGVATLTGSNSGNGRAGGRTTPAAAVAAPAAPGGGNSSSARNSCMASADAARSASTFYFANGGGRSYPVKWSDMTSSKPPIYKLATNVVINRANPKELDGRGWKLIMSGSSAIEPTFTCR
jgi:hypothetical protein